MSNLTRVARGSRTKQTRCRNDRCTALRLKCDFKKRTRNGSQLTNCNECVNADIAYCTFNKDIIRTIFEFQIHTLGWYGGGAPVPVPGHAGGCAGRTGLA